MQNDKAKEKNDNKDAIIKPDQETMHTTDPQDHMQGPVSSIVKDVKEAVEKQGKENTPETAGKA